MIYELITVGGILFWILSGITLLALVGEISNDKAGPAFFTLVAYVLVLVLFTNINLWEIIKNNPTYVIYAIGSYIVAGSVWSIAKWWLFLLSKRDEYENIRAKYLAAKGLTGIGSDPTSKKEWKDHMENVFGRYVSFPPKASEYKGKITTWMIFWPFSMIGTVLGDVINRVFVSIFEYLSGLMQRISNKVFGQYSELN